VSEWHWIKENVRHGPVPEAAFRALVSGGVIAPEDPVWRSGMADWLPAREITGLPWPDAEPMPKPHVEAETRGSPPTRPSPGAAIDERRLVDSRESTAFVLVAIPAAIAMLAVLVYVLWTFGVLLVFVGLLLVARLLGNAMASAHCRVNAIEVSAAQFPEIHRTARAFAQGLGRPLPDIYVVQDSVFNAFAVRFLGRPTVVLNSAVVDSVLQKGDAAQLAFIVGHELGHHYAGHLGWKSTVANWGSWLIWARLWYSRRCEFTCDRYGLACAGNLEAAQRAMCHLTVGTQLAGRVDLEAARRQWESRRDEFFVRYRALYSSHPHALDRLAALPAAAREIGVPAAA
jgi:Zn-dependent protease with chaperone function